METQSTASAQRDLFRDPTALVNGTRGFLCAYAAVSAFLVWTHATEYQALVRGDAVALPPLWMIPIALVVTLVTGVLVLTWTHRASYNVRALGATGLKFTPGWSVGWYFIPIANLWKPLQAMTETWRASVNPREWRRQAGSALLWCWWSFWILNFLVESAVDLAGWMGNFVNDGNRDILESASDAVSFGLRIPAALFLAAMIGRVHRMQMKHYTRQVAAGA